MVPDNQEMFDENKGTDEISSSLNGLMRSQRTVHKNKK